MKEMERSLNRIKSSNARLNFNWIKICLVGNSYTGKTSIIKAFCRSEFTKSYYPTVAVDYGYKHLKINNIDTHLTLWDFSGSHEYYDVRNDLYADTDAVIFVFDVNNINSFQNVDNWLNEINFHLKNKKKQSTTTTTTNKQVDYYLVGNKVDLIKKTTTPQDTNNNEIYLQYCQNHNINEYYELSATNTQKINQLFNNIVYKILLNRKIIS